MQQHKNERNVLSGWGLFGSPSHAAAMVLLILAPFAASVEVFIRKDMGERYFNYVNFIGGLLVIFVLQIIYYLVNVTFSQGLQGAGVTNWFGYAWRAYLVFSAYHFIYQWYRELTEKPLYSFYIGQSRLFFVGKIILKGLNLAMPTFVSIIARFLPKKEREDLLSYDVKLTDYRKITYLFVEPALVVYVGWQFWSISGIVGFWLVISGLMLLFHSNAVISKERNEFLDMRDSQIFANHLQDALQDNSDVLKVSETFKKTMQKMAEQTADNPELINDIENNSPSVAEALAKLRQKRQPEEQKMTS